MADLYTGGPDNVGGGILTRPFISGGWTWTGWDYRGEPTPYAWPNKNSHFGIMDLMGFWKDRTHWYASWFPLFNKGPDYKAKDSEIHLHAFPHWNWKVSGRRNGLVNIWSFSNAAEVELSVNGKLVSKQPMPKFSHVEWKVPFAKGSYTVTAYNEAGKSVGTKTVTTAGAPASLKATIRDGVGETLFANCNDFGLVQVEVLDANGVTCPDAENSDNVEITYSVSGTPTAWVEGTGNGDPSCGINNKSPMHPAYHGLALGVIGAGNATGTITVTASAPGLKSSSVSMDVVKPDTTAKGFSRKWCSDAPKW